MQQRTYCSRLKARRPCHSCFAGVELVADHRENTVGLQAVPACARVRPDYTASLLMSASDIPSRPSLRSLSNCDLVVGLPRTSRKIGDPICCRTPCLESAADRLETLAFDCFIQEQTEEFSVTCCLHREHCVNSGMRHRSDCRGRTTTHCYSQFERVTDRRTDRQTDRRRSDLNRESLLRNACYKLTKLKKEPISRKSQKTVQ